eukprot:1919447-Rhodomonas_salina.1
MEIATRHATHTWKFRKKTTTATCSIRSTVHVPKQTHSRLRADSIMLTSKRMELVRSVSMCAATLFISSKLFAFPPLPPAVTAPSSCAALTPSGLRCVTASDSARVGQYRALRSACVGAWVGGYAKSVPRNPGTGCLGTGHHIARE